MKTEGKPSETTCGDIFDALPEREKNIVRVIISHEIQNRFFSLLPFIKELDTLIHSGQSVRQEIMKTKENERNRIMELFQKLDQVIVNTISAINEKHTNQKIKEQQKYTESLQWVRGKINPALQKLSVSKFRDFSLLKQADAQLDVSSRQRWKQLIEKIEKNMPQILQENVGELIYIMQMLNDEWFKSVHLLCFMNGDAEKTNTLDIGMIQGTESYEFQGNLIPAYFIKIQHETTDSNLAYADPVSNSVVIKLSRIWTEVHMDKGFIEGNPIYMDALRSHDKNDSNIQAYIKYSQWRHTKYPDTSKLHQIFIDRILCEEIRHILDHIRLKSFKKSNDTHTAIGLLLQKEGILQKDLWSPLQGRKQSEQEIEKYRMALFEISAQITAAAVGPDPAFLFQEWLKNMRMLSSKDHTKKHPLFLLLEVVILNGSLR